MTQTNQRHKPINATNNTKPRHKFNTLRWVLFKWSFYCLLSLQLQSVDTLTVYSVTA